MIGRTNAVCVTSGGVTTVDLPTHPASISHNAKNQNVDIALTYSSTDFVSGVRVAYKTGAYPENPDDGEFVEAEGAAETVNVPNLTNGTTYYFRVFLYREIASVKYFQTDIINARCSATPNSIYVEGIDVAEFGEKYIVIAESGQFTIHGGTRPFDVYLVSKGGNGHDGHYQEASNQSHSQRGGNGGSGGYVLKHTFSEISENATFTCAVDNSQSATTLSTTNVSLSSKSGTYKPGGSGASGVYGNNAGKGTDGVLTPYGYIGSSGGGGGYRGSITNAKWGFARGGVGAGNGSYEDGQDATNYGCGGGGGGGNIVEKTNYTGGKGVQGCIIIAWD